MLKVGGKLNNVVILVTRFWSEMDLAPFGIKLFIYFKVSIGTSRLSSISDVLSLITYLVSGDK